MYLKPIKTASDYEAALERIEEIFDASPNTPESDELEILAILVEKYEDEHFPIPAPDPIAAIKFRMEQLGLQQKDLAELIGQRSHVSEMLSGKRPLTLKAIKTIHNKMGVPFELMMQ